MYIVLATHFGATAPVSVHSSIEGARQHVLVWAKANDAEVSMSGDSAHGYRVFIRTFFIETEE